MSPTTTSAAAHRGGSSGANSSGADSSSERTSVDSGTAVVAIDLGVCSARSSRQPANSRRSDPVGLNPFAERRLGGQPLAVRMARRLSDCQWCDQIFAVGCNLSAAVLRDHQTVLHPINLPDCHLVERLAAVADRTDADWIVYVPANRPFVDASLIDGLLAKASREPDCDYIAYASDLASHQRMDRLGLAGEVCHVDMLRRLRRNADRLPRSRSIAECLESAPGAYHLRFVPVPPELDRDDLRFAVEDESDWDDAELLCESVCDEDAEWQQVANLVIANPSMRGGRLYGGRQVKLYPVKAEIGEQGTVLATPDVIADLKSVARFIEVSGA